MQGQKSAGGSFTETVDLNQGPVSSSGAMNQSGPWNNVPNPVESSRLLLSSAERNITRDTSGSHGIRGFSGWDLGESSSGANVQGQGPSESFDGDFLGNQGINRPLFMQNSSSSPVPLNIEQIMTGNASSPNVGTSSGNSGNAAESDSGAGGSAPSVGSWGSSCKRKAVEGTSDQAFSVGSSNSHYNAPGNLNISSLPVTSPSNINPSEQLNPRPGLSMWVVGSDLFPPSSARGIAETSSRNYSSRLNLGHNETGRFNLPTTANASRHSDSPNQSYPVHAPDLSRNMHPFSWNGANSRAGASSSPLMLSGDRRASSSRDEGNFGSSSRNSMEHPMFVPATEARNLVQDPNNWNLSTGSVPPHSVLPAWIHDHPNPPAQNQQRLPEFAPWTLFPSVGSEPGGQRGHFSQMRPGPSEERMMSPSGGNNQGHRHPPHSRSSWLMEAPGDDVSGWRALATDIEGRHRLVSEIRQVLNAMRRSENIRAEDYMLFDPFVNGVPEFHDRHRDMRLDVDNMSYEELLALEERIGDVNTGLSEEAIAKSMQQQKYVPVMGVSPINLEPCCICREEYVGGDDVGKLSCGHDFHTDCIKQWLKQKNICPICKMTGLST